MMSCTMVSLLLLAWRACALHNPTHHHESPDGAEGNMLEVQGNATSVSLLPIASGLAGCKSGNFAAKGSNKCAGIQALRCDGDGGCVGKLQGNAYKINCNAKHECVTEAWGGTMVRKYFSTTSHAGVVDWNNGCSWICEEETSTLTQSRAFSCKKDTTPVVCARCYKDSSGNHGCGWSSKHSGSWAYYDAAPYNAKYLRIHSNFKGGNIATGKFSDGDGKVKCKDSTDSTGLSLCAPCCANKDYKELCQCEEPGTIVVGSVDVTEGQ